MIEVTELVLTGDACPSQWEGKTTDGRGIYARYRWGVLRVYWQQRDKIEWETPIFEHDTGVELHGVMETETLIAHLAELFDFSACKFYG